MLRLLACASLLASATSLSVEVTAATRGGAMEAAPAPPAVYDHSWLVRGGGPAPPRGRTAIVVLNSDTAGGSLAGLRHLWGAADTRVCADGGANRLYALDPELLPTEITGDLDSLQPEVRAYYAARGVPITKRHDQDKHDLDKALQAVHGTGPGPAPHTVVVWGAFGTRFDHVMASINTLYHWADRFEGELLLLSATSLAVLVPAGRPTTIVPAPGLEGPTCGLIPVGARADRVTTTGLTWNLDGAPLEFGGLISTSNAVAAPGAPVGVDASGPLVWTSELHPEVWDEFVT